MATHLIWFRNDLRITDNLALHAACQDPQATVIALFIATPAQWAAHDMAPRQAAFLLQNLQQLQHALAIRGYRYTIISVMTFRTPLSGWMIFVSNSKSMRYFLTNNMS